MHAIGICIDQCVPPNATVDRLATPVPNESADDFKLRQQAAGFNHLPAGMLLQPQCRGIVRPYTHALVEPAHTLYVHGVGNTALYLYFEAVFQEGVTGIHARLHEFLGTWTWPHGVGKDQLVELFSPARVRSWRTARHFKADASKFLQVFPVLVYWVAAYGIAGMVARDDANALLAFRDLHDHVFLRRLGRCTSEQLGDLVWGFLNLCEKAGWHASMHPKFHWLVHLAWGLLISALICESKHRVPKRYAREQCNLTGFDKGVLSSTMAEHFADLADEDRMSFEPRLNAPSRPTARLADICHRHFGDSECLSARTARLQNRGAIATGDVVLLSTRGVSGNYQHINVCAGEVWAICSVDGQPLAMVSVWEHMIEYDRGTRSAKWHYNEASVEFWSLVDVLHACIYRKVAADRVVTLIPIQFQSLFV